MSPRPVAQFSAQCDIRRVFLGYDVNIQIRDLSADVSDETQLTVIAWMYLSGALQRRGIDVIKMARQLPHSG